MDIQKISAEEFPEGHGSRFRATQEWYDLIKQILLLKPTEALRVSSVGESKTSANSLRSSVIDELTRKHKDDEFKVQCNRDETGFYNLFVKRR